jgi:hypothetical protein
MSNSIGRVVNQIAKLWSLPQDEETSDYIKVMSMMQSKTMNLDSGFLIPMQKNTIGSGNSR